MPVTNLVSRLRAEVARVCAAYPAGGRLVVAVSGGPDSMCLADALIALKADVTLAHLNHQLRGADADADAAYVRAFAAARGVPCVVDTQDVAALAQARNQSIELAAREARYAFLARAAAEAGAPDSAAVVAVAHNADDQAETVLLRLVRGTGIEGLRAMAPSAPLPGAPAITLLRPLLRVTRADIEQYCADLELQPRHDASNVSLEHTRNRVRHELLPLLQQFNPGVKQVLARLADSAAADLDIVAFATRQAFDAIATVGDAGITVDRAAWRALPEGLQRAVLREGVRRLKGELTNLNFAAIEEAREVLHSPANSGDIALMSDVRIAVRLRHFTVAVRGA